MQSPISKDKIDLFKGHITESLNEVNVYLNKCHEIVIQKNKPSYPKFGKTEVIFLCDCILTLLCD